MKQINRKMELPKKYQPQEVESKWQKYWEEKAIYRFDPKSEKPVYSIDTPPPTVSGKMHLGHSFSYSQQDFLVRYKRMKGFNIFFPFGTDDNGLATERLIEKEKGVKSAQMDRQEFVKLCLTTLKKIRPKYLADWKAIGMSCQWDIFYTTIDDHSRKISQWSFLDLYQKGREYRKEAPTVWCPECRTAIAQVEMEDKQIESTFNDIVFKIENQDSSQKSQDLIIATTRPELLPACVAIFYHPEDKRYQKLKGKKAKVPLFNFEVPILKDERADPEKGTGIVMCCTFGDQTDVEWFKAHNLPLKEAITKEGLMTEIAGKYQGLKIKQAREKIIEDLKAQGLLKKQEKITHPVNVHERCGTELEILNSKQWFIKYLDLKDQFLEQGKIINWHPAHMISRYNNWVKGLQWDWCISRQRLFGVPFPVWYCAQCDEVILAKEEDLPVDPLKDTPPVKQCPQCESKEFIPENDVLDTWATSSLTPQLSTWLLKDKKLQDKVYPMSLRPQAHDIISFWLFNTLVKSYLHFKKIPWKNVAISGWALDPKGRKMSKSKGNVIEPQEMIKKYSADCLRFWASNSKLGEDVPFQEKEFVTAQKLITKLWNASKFCLMHLEDYDPKSQTPKNFELIDRWLLSKLNQLIQKSTQHYDNYDYNHPRLDTENFFWHTFCDNYLEMVKDRLYNPDQRGEQARKSAQYTLYHSLLTILKLFAPILSHITEEIYSHYFKEKEDQLSIHISLWPEADPSLISEEAENIGDKIIEIVMAVRKFKTEHTLSLKEEISSIIIEADKKDFQELLEAQDDLKATTKAKEIKQGKGDLSLESGLKIKIQK